MVNVLCLLNLLKLEGAVAYFLSSRDIIERSDPRSLEWKESPLSLLSSILHISIMGLFRALIKFVFEFLWQMLNLTLLFFIDFKMGRANNYNSIFKNIFFSRCFMFLLAILYNSACWF